MPRILLVEDNEMNRDMLSRRLARRGYDVTVAVDGAEGVRRARETLPDLVLMDMSLPVLDGWEATRALKRAADTCHIPVIGLTAHAMAGDEAQARAAGCDEFETKPVELDRLLGKIAALLARHEPAAVIPHRREMQLDAATVADLSAIRAFVADAASAAGIPASVTDGFVLAADEVSTNVLRHGYPGACGPIMVAFSRAARSASLVIVDHGIAFPPDRAPRAEPLAPWETRPIGGLGWHIVRSVVDEVHYTTTEGANHLTLVKSLSG